MEVCRERQRCSWDRYGKPLCTQQHQSPLWAVGTVTKYCVLHFSAIWWKHQLMSATNNLNAKRKTVEIQVGLWEVYGSKLDLQVLTGTVQLQICVCVSRCGPLFNTGFLRRMLSAAVQHSMDDIQPLVKTLICESECTTLKSLVHGPSALTNQGKSPTSRLWSVTCVWCLCLQNILFPLQWSVESSLRPYRAERSRVLLISLVSPAQFLFIFGGKNWA